MDKTIRAKKALGQHFLIDPRYCRRIVEFAAPQTTEWVIEIGPGTGRLTHLLLDRAARVIGIEYDSCLVDHLRTHFEACLQTGQFTVLEQDVLDIDWARPLPTLAGVTDVPLSRAGPTVKLVGNLPYNIATRIIRRTCESTVGFQSATFTTQKEVAERILAGPGNGDYGYLTVLVEYRYHRTRGFDIPAGAFRPRPKVVSHVFQLEPRQADVDRGEFERLDSLVQRAFGHRRKTLWNNLLPSVRDSDLLDAALHRAGVGRRDRPETVSLEQFLCMSSMLSLTP